ncbi:MAG: hypothetical protein LBM62_09685 [Mediterranea sp.]|jgi:hypothetical protein|nr:hypothetical protein [Mediterranea sp.]
MKNHGLKTIFAVAFALVMGVSLTSCFNSESSSERDATVLVKVNQYMGLTYFETADGMKIYPTQASIASYEVNSGTNLSSLDGKWVYAYYYWDTKILDIPQDATEVKDVTLGGINDAVTAPLEIVEAGATPDSVNNTPIITVSLENSFEPYMPDDHSLLLPINYFLSTKLHSFTLVYFPDEEQQADELKLYLYHDKEGDEPNMQTTSLAILMDAYSNYELANRCHVFYKTFNLGPAIDHYTNKTGFAKPTKVVIVTTESQSGLSLEDAVEKEYTVEYKPVGTN